MTSVSDAHRSRSKQRTILLSLLLAVAGTAAICLPAYLSPESFRLISDSSQLAEEIQQDAEVSRFLMERSLDDIDGFYKELSMPRWLQHASARTRNDRTTMMKDGKPHDHLGPAMASAISERQNDSIGWGSRRLSTSPLAPYSIEDVVESTSVFLNTVGIIMYDPEKDDFEFLYNRGSHDWVSGCTKLVTSYRNFAYMLRQLFPERFQGAGSPELAIAIGSGDFPHFTPKCLDNYPHTSPDCAQKDAPILQFGSVFRHSEIVPNMIAMPMPMQNGMRCFKEWAVTGSVCSPFRGIGSGSDGSGTLVFGESKFEDLIPQVVWRGTDFGYLRGIYNLRMPDPKADIADKIDPAVTEQTTRENVAALREIYDSLIPRWKGVVVTAEAELEAEEKQQQQQDQQGQPILPWCDIKFTGPAGEASAEVKARYGEFKEYGISTIGNRMSLEELAKFKYHIDLGGGGGTTWAGTVQKMAMPGLLFHHETPTKDYIHYRMKPWIHYVPVAPDLRDLKAKYDWAERNPEAAKMIATQGSDLIRRLGTPEGFSEMYEEDFVEQVRRAVDAYQPVSTTHPGSAWRQILKDYEGDGIRGERISAVWQCTGNSPHQYESCVKNG